MIKEYHVSENLWNEDYTDISSVTITYKPVYVGDGQFTLSTSARKTESENPSRNGNANIFLLSGNVSSGASTNGNGVWSTQQRTVTSDNGYVTIAYRYLVGDNGSNPQYNTTMLNKGSTPKPYDIYGNTWNTKSYAKSITGAQTYTKFPIVLRTTEQSIPTWSMDGNTETSGTPTPSNPVEVNGVGVRTENLWNEDYTGISDTIIYKSVYVGDGNFTLSTTAPQSSDPAALLFLLSGNVSSGASSSTNGVWNGQNRTKAAVDGYVTVAYRAISNYTPVGSQTMLNTGSTVKSYEPYGYKIPITDGGVTTNIYLGSTQSIRPIREIAFKGTESWVKSRNDVDDYLYHVDIGATYAGAIADIISTHLPFLNRLPNADEQGCTLRTYQDNYRIIYINFGSAIMNAQTSGNTAQGLKEYLAAQNTNGTPFTVWHTLLSPTTAIVNKPLMKIGTYADTLSNATAIPTTSGLNTIDVNTTVKPSEMSLTYDGYKICKEQKYQNNAWS